MLPEDLVALCSYVAGCCDCRTREILEIVKANPLSALRGTPGEPERGWGSDALLLFSPTLWPLVHSLFPVVGPQDFRASLPSPLLSFPAPPLSSPPFFL